jgi:hypothetical protein
MLVPPTEDEHVARNLELKKLHGIYDYDAYKALEEAGTIDPVTEYFIDNVPDGDDPGDGGTPSVTGVTV